jgi:hypothetical protein
LQSVVIPMRCSESGKRLRVIFARADADSVYQIQEIKSGSAVSTRVGPSDAPALVAGIPAAGVQHPSIDNGVVDARLVSWNGFLCPHCQAGSPTSVIRCGRCNELVCGATYRPLRGGRYVFSCGACGNKTSGFMTRPIESFDAKPVGPAPSEVPALPAGRGILGAARGLLPRGNRRK